LFLQKKGAGIHIPFETYLLVPLAFILHEFQVGSPILSCTVQKGGKQYHTAYQGFPFQNFISFLQFT
jgi:hypothetical protein